MGKTTQSLVVPLMEERQKCHSRFKWILTSVLPLTRGLIENMPFLLLEEFQRDRSRCTYLSIIVQRIAYNKCRAFDVDNDIPSDEKVAFQTHQAVTSHNWTSIYMGE